MLRERIGAREVAATVAIVAGVVGITLSAPKNSESYSGDWRLVAVLAALAALAAVPYFAGQHARRAGGLLVVSAGAAIAASAFMSKLITDELAAHQWAGALGWGVATGIAAVGGLLSEMSALQRRPANRVAPPIFVISTVVPVMCAPFLTGENWGKTPLGGAVIVASLVAVAVGGAALGRSKAVGDLVAASHRD
jgi:drug/metabolite transporter (DMT)-like permease